MDITLTSSSSKKIFTCLKCNIVFQEPDAQLRHFKSEWHCYNLKRGLAGLPAITEVAFIEKSESFKKSAELENRDERVCCKSCRKWFGNQKAFENHIKSKKHKDNEARSPQQDICEPLKTFEEENNVLEESDIEEIDSDEWEEDIENPIDDNNCIFCLHHSKNFLNNLEHMTIVHSFFIPDIEYCTDVKGLLHYLGEKISKDFICIWCNEKGKTFYSSEAARMHMMDKGHCKMAHEGLSLIEYEDYYDYSSSYPDQGVNDNKEEEVVIPELDSTEYQLVLPSGAVVGHRSLMRYYKQKLNLNTDVVISNKKNKLHKILSTYKALGWSETEQQVAKRKAKDLHYMKRMQSKFRLKLGVKGNKLQTHFRAQVQF